MRNISEWDTFTTTYIYCCLGSVHVSKNIILQFFDPFVILKSSRMIEKKMFIIHMSSIPVNIRHHWIVSQVYYKNKLKLALIGQSVFGQEVYSHLCKEGHRVVGVFTVPDKDGKADPLGECILERRHQGLCAGLSALLSLAQFTPLIPLSTSVLPLLCHKPPKPRLHTAPRGSAMSSLPIENLLRPRQSA